MNLWSPSRSELEDLPGIVLLSDGTIDFEFSADEQTTVDSFFKFLEAYQFHPEIAESMPRAATAFALCRHAIDLALSLPDVETPEELHAKAIQITSILSRVLAALYKAQCLYPTAVFTYQLIHANKLAGRTVEADRLQRLRREQEATWRPSQLDQLFISWLQDSFPNVPIYRTA